MKSTFKIQFFGWCISVLTLSAILSLLVSCTKQVCADEIVPSGENHKTYLKIGSVTTSLLTKSAVQGTKFPTAEKASIGIFLVGTGYEDARYKNIEYTKPAGSDVWTGPEIELTSSSATVYAYYPYQEGMTDISQLPIVSSIDKDDWMWAMPVEDVSSSKPAIALTLKHAIALVEITFNNFGYDSSAKISNITLTGNSFSSSGTLDATTGALMPGTACSTGFSQDVELSQEECKIVANCLLIPTKTGTEAEVRQDFKVSITFGGKTLNASLTGEKGVVVRQGTKSTIRLNVKNGDSKMEVVSVGVDEWNDKVSGNRAEVDGHIVTFNCPEGLKYGLHLEQEASGSFDEDVSGILEQVLTFSYDGSAPSLPQDKFLVVEGPASGCKFNLDKAKHTITVTDVETDINFNLSFGKITFIPYTATEKVEPKDKKISGLPLNEQKSTFNGTSGVMAIDGEVTVISDNAFNGNKALTGITLPEGITSIGQSAFDECHNLVLPQLPNSITYLGKYAFRRAGKSASQTSDLVLPEDLTTIERYAFEECRVKTLTGNAKLQTIWIGAFKKCNDLTDITFNSEIAPTIVEGGIFPETDLTRTSGIAVPKIANHASLLSYKNANWWKDIANGIIREEGTTVTLFHYTASAKINLKTGEGNSFGEGVEYLNDESCSRYDSSTSNGEWFFIGQGSAIPMQIPAEMFLQNDNLQSIVIPEGVKTIGEKAFNSCLKLKSVSFPTTLETIGGSVHSSSYQTTGAFQACKFLESIDFSGCSNLNTIPDGCFRNCSRVTSLQLPENLSTIGTYAFEYLGYEDGYTGVQSLTIPATLTSLGYHSFSYSKINNVTLYSNLANSYNSTEAFYKSSVESVIFEDGSNPALTMFGECQIKTITSKSTTPPNLCLDIHSEEAVFITNYSSIVYVPASSVDTYKQDHGWKKFSDIRAIGQ
ncbi:MAG: leucine-rich repeat protein [Alistipes sp.]|nr:leucine-rich repeat protein [Candidatus Alistipes equi]